MIKFHTHYDNLQVSPQASTAVIRAAYKALSQKWHPDKHPNDPKTSNKKFYAIKLAYDVLSNADLREKYDQETKRHNRRSTDKERTPTNKLTEQYSTKKIKKHISIVV